MTMSVQEIQQMSEVWRVLFPDVEPPPAQRWALWSLQHDASTIRKGLIQLATKYRNLNGKMEAEYMGKFLSVVLNRLSSK